MDLPVCVRFAPHVAAATIATKASNRRTDHPQHILVAVALMTKPQSLHKFFVITCKAQFLT